MAKRSTPEWLVMTSDGEARWTSAKLRKRILEKEVSGEERVRRLDEPDSALRPLHSTELFQQTLGLSPGNAALEAAARRVRGFAAHAVAFVGVGALLSFPWWMVFWGIGLVSHLTSAAPSLRRLQASGRAWPAFLGDLSDAEPTALPAPEPAAEPVAAAEPAPESEAPGAEADLPASVASDWAALEAQMPGLPEPARRQLESARDHVQALHARGRKLAALLAEEDAAALDAEAAELEVELAAAPDHRTAELLEQSKQALEFRRDAVAELAAGYARVQAQLRALGHQLRSARLAIAGREPDAAADLSGVLDGLAQQSRSAQELEDTLARARRARAAGRVG